MKNQTLLDFIAEQCSADQCEEVLAWIEESEENKKYFSELKNMWVAAELVKAERRSVVVPKSMRFNVRKLIFNLLKTAVAAAVVVGVYYVGRDNEKRVWHETAAGQYTQIKVPAGETTSITLDDGTTVRLNSNSVMRFSKNYGVRDRDIELDGEGYFEVVKNSAIPFVVNGKSLNIRVLGTKFNVSTYQEDRCVTATLYEGGVMVENFTKNENVILHPNETYIYDKISREVRISRADHDYHWRNNYIVADGEDIFEFAKKIERKYKVKIVIDETLRGKCIYTGSFKNETLDEVLALMKIASNIDYKIESDTVSITPKLK